MIYANDQTEIAPNGLPVKPGGAITGQDWLSAAPNLIGSIGDFIGSVTGKQAPSTVVYSTPQRVDKPVHEKNYTPFIVIGVLILIGTGAFFFLWRRKK